MVCPILSMEDASRTWNIFYFLDDYNIAQIQQLGKNSVSESNCEVVFCRNRYYGKCLRLNMN